MHRVYLIPGFFGFANLGDLRYFGHVYRSLEAAFVEAGIDARVHEIPTRPTASLHQRAARLFDTIAQTADDTDVLHLIGHSSGGLDARLLVSPGVQIDRDVEGMAQRVRTVVTVSSPHRGTPSAATFGSAAGKPLLRLLSIMTMVVVRQGRIPLSALIALSRLVRSAPGPDDGMVDELFTGLLDALTPERRDAIAAFFSDVGEDQALLTQITPDAADLFRSAVPDRPSVRYGAVVTRARPPGLASVAEAGIHPYAQASLALYATCHRLAAWDRAPTWLTPAQSHALSLRWPKLDPADNDAMVPTTSQVWGEVIDAADADHLDIIGHFTGSDLAPPHYDWLRTGTGFRRPAYEQVWDRVFAFLVS